MRVTDAAWIAAAGAVSERGHPMLDAVFLSLVLGFFALCRGAVAAAERG